MSNRVRLSDLAGMTNPEADRELDRLANAAIAPRNGQRAELAGRIRTFEQRYEMTSDELRTKIRHGEVKETAEIVHWLFLLAARDSGTR